jgi:hypothetical protein
MIAGIIWAQISYGKKHWDGTFNVRAGSQVLGAFNYGILQVLSHRAIHFFALTRLSMPSLHRSKWRILTERNKPGIQAGKGVPEAAIGNGC